MPQALLTVLEQMFIDIRKNASFSGVGMRLHFYSADLQQAAPHLNAAPLIDDDRFRHCWQSRSLVLIHLR